MIRRLDEVKQVRATVPVHLLVKDIVNQAAIKDDGVVGACVVLLSEVQHGPAEAKPNDALEFGNFQTTLHFWLSMLLSDSNVLYDEV